MTAGSRLRRARVEAGLSQAELADRVGVTQGAVSLWEAGKAAPGRPAQLVVAAVLHVDVDVLWPEQVTS